MEYGICFTNTTTRIAVMDGVLAGEEQKTRLIERRNIQHVIERLQPLLVQVRLIVLPVQLPTLQTYRRVLILQDL